MLGGSLLMFLLLFFLFFSLPSDQIGGGFLVCYFSSRSLLLFVFVCSDGMEREACVCDHGLERSDLCVCVCVCVFFPFILDIKFVGRTSRGHTGGRSHRISRPPSFCGACLNFSREKDSAIPFPRRP